MRGRRRPHRRSARPEPWAITTIANIAIRNQTGVLTSSNRVAKDRISSPVCYDKRGESTCPRSLITEYSIAAGLRMPTKIRVAADYVFVATRGQFRPISTMDAITSHDASHMTQICAFWAPAWLSGNIKVEIRVVQNVAIHRASDLPQNVRSAVEQLLGRSIEANEEISVVAVPPQDVPPSKNRAELARKLEDFLDRRAKKVADIPDQELDRVIDEAVDHVRHSRG